MKKRTLSVVAPGVPIVQVGTKLLGNNVRGVVTHIDATGITIVRNWPPTRPGRKPPTVRMTVQQFQRSDWRPEQA